MKVKVIGNTNMWCSILSLCLSNFYLVVSVSCMYMAGACVVSLDVAASTFTVDRLPFQHITHPHMPVCSQGNVALCYTSCIYLSCRCILERARSKVEHNNKEIALKKFSIIVHKLNHLKSTSIFH